MDSLQKDGLEAYERKLPVNAVQRLLSERRAEALDCLARKTSRWRAF